MPLHRVRTPWYAWTLGPDPVTVHGSWILVLGLYDNMSFHSTRLIAAVHPVVVDVLLPLRHLGLRRVGGGRPPVYPSVWPAGEGGRANGGAVAGGERVVWRAAGMGSSRGSRDGQ